MGVPKDAFRRTWEYWVKYALGDPGRYGCNAGPRACNVHPFWPRSEMSEHAPDEVL